MLTRFYRKARVRFRLTCPITDSFFSVAVSDRSFTFHVVEPLQSQSRLLIEASGARSVLRVDAHAELTWLFPSCSACRGSAPGSAPYPQTQWRDLRLPTTCALWRKFEKPPKRLPSTPFVPQRVRIINQNGFTDLDAGVASPVRTQIHI